MSFVCGQCHVRQQQLFNESAHRSAYEEAGLAACVTCHENHDIEKPTEEMLAAGEKGVCKNCHQPGDKGFVAAGQLLEVLGRLADNNQKAQEVLDRAERAGMEISKAKFRLSEGNEKLVQARVLVHTVSASQVTAVAQEGMKIAQESYSAGIAALEEISFRRRGLLISVVFILIAVLGLFFKIRKMESNA
jgi:predicted CXXCH cytochrome family protein